MNYVTLIKANFRSKKGVFTGVGVLIFVITVCLCAVINIFVNAGGFEERELDRTGYGDITYWVTDSADIKELMEQIEALDEVERAEARQSMFVAYRVNGGWNGSSAFGLPWEEGEGALHIYEDDLSGIAVHPAAPKEGEVYVPPSFQALYNARLGDSVDVYITGEEDVRKYRIAGWLEDPVAGSSIMGFKTILFNEKDYGELREIFGQGEAGMQGTNIYSLHITGKDAYGLSAGDLQRLLNERTDLSRTTICAYQKTAIAGFMMLFQMIISGILLVFVLVLLAVALIVIGRSITGTIEEDYVDMGILKAVGYTRAALRRAQILQYVIVTAAGMLIGLPVSVFVAGAVNRLMIPINGILINGGIPWLYTLAALGTILILFVLFILAGTARIGKISPIRAIRGGAEDVYFKDRFTVAVYQRGLGFWLALRQLLSGKRQYISACLVAALLVFFLSVMGRLGAWIGEDGRGLMTVLSMYDLGVLYPVCGTQENRDASGIQREAEENMTALAGIADSFEGRQTKGTVNGMEYILYALSKPEHYNIVEGRTCKYANEIVITEFVAGDLDVWIGDTVQVTYQGSTGDFLISGIYQCPNDLGSNFGMSMEGYASIGGSREGDDANRTGITICYIFEDRSKTEEIAEWLEDTYGADIQVFDNSWSGIESLLDVLSAMNVLEHVICVFFIAVVAFMTGHRIIYRERRDLGIYKSLGFSSGMLRGFFGLRFAIVSALGSVLGVIGSAVFTDPIASSVLKTAGISRVISHLDPVSMLTPAVVVTALFYGFAWLLAGGIKKAGAEVLIVE